MFRRIAALLLAFLLPVAAMADTLSAGDRGKSVLTLKERLYDLGYYEKKNFTKVFNEDTADTVREFQRLNGLEETGEVSEETWELLFSDDAVKRPRPTLVPLASPAPTPDPGWPARDAEGFLEGDGEFVYENDEEGLWIYLNSSLQVTVTFRRDPSVPLEWFETEIVTRNSERFRTVATDPERPGKKYRYPYDIAEDAGFVLGFSDDFYAERMNKKQTVGIIIREGEILSRKTNSKAGHYLPNLDMMAQYPDGSLKVFGCNEKTAEEFLAEGAVNVFSFGPWLLRNGEINPLVYDYYQNIEPRHALGMISPNRYLLLSVQGRMNTSKGTTLRRVAEMMREKGVAEALNLDGGNTMALVFRGRMLNKLATYKKKKFVRTVTSLIGIGTVE